MYVSNTVFTEQKYSANFNVSLEKTHTISQKKKLVLIKLKKSIPMKILPVDRSSKSKQ